MKNEHLVRSFKVAVILLCLSMTACTDSEIRARLEVKVRAEVEVKAKGKDAEFFLKKEVENSFNFEIAHLINDQNASVVCLVENFDMMPPESLGGCLVWASTIGNLLVVKQILDACLDGVIQEAYWNSALDRAGENGHTEIVWYIENYQVPECLT